MNGKTCFFIGNRHTPSDIKQQLAEVTEKHIIEYGVTNFTVGGYGNFDNLVQGVLRETKKSIPRLNCIYLPLMLLIK